MCRPGCAFKDLLNLKLAMFFFLRIHMMYQLSNLSPAIWYVIKQPYYVLCENDFLLIKVGSHYGLTMCASRLY